MCRVGHNCGTRGARQYSTVTCVSLRGVTYSVFKIHRGAVELERTMKNGNRQFQAPEIPPTSIKRVGVSVLAHGAFCRQDLSDDIVGLRQGLSTSIYAIVAFFWMYHAAFTISLSAIDAMTTDNFIVTTRVSAIFCNDKAHGAGMWLTSRGAGEKEMMRRLVRGLVDRQVCLAALVDL